MLTAACRAKFDDTVKLRSRLWLVVFTLSGLASINEAVAVEGAFGLSFNEQLTPTQLGASIDPSLLTSLLSDQPDVALQQDLASWRAFAPQALPKRLRALNSHMFVQLSESNTPTWIAASFGSKDCRADLEWLLEVLKKKYAQPDLAIRTTTSPQVLSDSFNERLLFEFKNVVVAAGCSDPTTSKSRLQIEYWHRPAAATIRQEQKARDAMQSELANERALAAKALGESRGRAVASTVASGSRYNIEQVFGIPLKRVVKAPGNFVVDEFVDYPLQGVTAPYRGKTAKVQLGPAGHLIRFELKIADPQAAEFKRLRDALQQEFSQPTKSTRKHVIFSVGADYLILRRRLGQLEFTLISGSGEKGLKSRQLAAQEEQWQKENAGI